MFNMNKPLKIWISGSPMSTIRFCGHVSMSGLLLTLRRVLIPVSGPVAHDVFPIPDSLMPGTAVFKSPPVPCNVQRPWNTSRFSGGITCCPLTEPGPAIPARSVVPPVVKGRKEKHERELPIGCHPVGSQPQLARIEE